MKPLLFAAWLASAGTDLASTEHALSLGAIESHPLLANRGARISLVMSTATLMPFLLTREPWYREHKTLAWTITVLANSVRVYASVHNSRSRGIAGRSS